MFTLLSACELCGRRSLVCYPSVDGFGLCGRCAKLHNHTTTPVGELIAQKLLQDQAAESQRALQTQIAESSRRGGCGWLVMVGLLAAGYFYFVQPEKIRTPMQVPVMVSVRSSMLGVGNVIQVANKSNIPLKNVILRVHNPGKNSGLAHNFGEIAPQTVVELGTLDWGWVFEPGEKVTISADDFMQIVFTTEQLGLK